MSTPLSGVDTVPKPNQDPASLVQQVKQAVEKDPSLTMQQLVNFLTDECPDPVPLERASDPLFYDSLKNGDKYTYLTKEGFGLHKDGTKLHGFRYECVENNRSKDLFGDDIDSAMGVKDDDTTENVSSSSSSEETVVDKAALANALLAAFNDLIINANGDMKSYLYLTQKAPYALSNAVKEKIGDKLASDGGIALALVTELVATVDGEALFKKAATEREDDQDLAGIAALNEDNVEKVYAAITPAVQTEGILLNHGVDMNQEWVKNFIIQAPNVDKLVGMEFNSFKGLLPEPSASTSLAPVDIGERLKNMVQPPAGDELVAHRMYAGLLGTIRNAQVPALRGYLLESGLGLEVANQMEKDGKSDVGEMNDKQVYKTASDTLTKLMDSLKTPGEDSGGENNGSVQANLDLDFEFQKKLMDAKQTASAEKKVGKIDKNGFRRRRPLKFSKGAAGKLVGKVNVGLKGSVTAAGRAGAAGALASAAGSAGALAASVGPALAAAGPALAIALAVAPILQDLAAANERAMERDLEETRGEREAVAKEVQELLDSVNNLATEDKLEDREKAAAEMIDKVRNSDALKLSTPEGMALQRQLAALETTYSPTGMGALKPYSSNEELVAAVNGGQALSALSLFVNPDIVADTPDRQLLQTPKYVNMMGSTTPFYTKSYKSTSESEMTSFVTSSRHSGFSTASKGSESRSISADVKVNAFVGGLQGKFSGASEKRKEESASYSNDSRHKAEQKSKVTEALVSEFTYMPMKTFRLREGGLVLTPYAFYRLQKIIDVGTVKNDISIENIKREKARMFIQNFGSHIPFGTQTLGGVFVRSMKITTKQETSVSEMYSAASSRLTATSSEASKVTTDRTARAGLFGGGVSATTSLSFASANSSGMTKASGAAGGSGTGQSDMDSKFESHVTCFGPNAPTPDSLYQQLMNNNATWTVIDRGEPDSYFAIWDLVDYMGQGGQLEEQCQLLREVWEEMALSNSPGGRKELLEMVMRNGKEKQRMYDFVQHLIDCLVLKNHVVFDSDLAAQFEKALKKGLEFCFKGEEDAAEEVSVDPSALKEKARLQELVEQVRFGDPSALIEIGLVVLGEQAKFELVKGTTPYDLAVDIMLETKNTDWSKYFVYYSDTFASEILEKGKQNYLVKLCRELFEAGDDNNGIIHNWKLVEKLLEPTAPQNDGFDRHIENSLLIKDDEVVDFDGERTIGNHCLHYVLRSNDLRVVELVHRKCPRVAEIKNKKFLPDESVKDLWTPREIISNDKNDLYTNLKGYQFPESFKTESVAIMPSKTWRILAKGAGNWDIQKIEFFSEYSKNQEVAITTQPDKAESSDSADATNHGPIEAFNTDYSSYWQGLSDREGCWISMEFDSPQIVKSIRIVNGPNKGHRVNKLYIQAKKFGEWQTQSINSRLDQNLDFYSVDVGDWGLEHSDRWNLLTFTQATSSSQYSTTGWEPERALDASGMFSTAHEQNPWWKGTLDGTAEISKIIITQRSDNPQLWFRMLHFQLTIFKGDKEVYYSDEHGLDEERAYEINLTTPVKGDSVMIRLPRFNPKMDQEPSEPNTRILTLKDVRAYNSDVGPYTEALVQFERAEASSIYNVDWKPEYAMQGHPNKSFHSYVDSTKHNPWWKGILPDQIEISRISIYNRHDGRALYRMLGFQLIIFRDGVEVYYSLAHGRQVKDIYEINFKDPEGRDTTVEGDAVMIRLPRNNPQTMTVEPLNLGEVRVYKRTDV